MEEWSNSKGSFRNVLRNECTLAALLNALIFLLLLTGVLFLFHIFDNKNNANDKELPFFDLDHIRESYVSPAAEQPNKRDANCRFWDCIDLYRCEHRGRAQLTIYVYPLQQYVDGESGKPATQLSREYYQILKAVVNSPYYTSNPNEACLFLPSIDLLNEELVDTDLAGRALASLEHWDRGENHIIFNMLPGKFPNFNRMLNVKTDRAIILGGGFDVSSYRPGFDISIPVWNPSITDETVQVNFYRPSKFLLTIAQSNIEPEYHRILSGLAKNHSDSVLYLRSCSDGSGYDVRCSARNRHKYRYPQVLSDGSFCLLTRGFRLGHPEFLEMLQHNCIPVLAIDSVVLPFEDVIDWSLAIVQIHEMEMHYLVDRLSAISPTRVFEMRQQGSRLFQRYLKDLKTITMTSLQILESRIFPHSSDTNAIDQASVYGPAARNPLFLPLIAPKSEGFTAVILTYDRVESLFTLIQKLSVVPSLQSILIIWNNQRRSPPHASAYPSISKPLKVIQTRANKLSNRFYPYAEIETEAVLSIDDDITMLTADELDFGFEVWREFPDRIVGFPSRIHVWDNDTMRWHYESEWTNQISMVLTGAAFHHKYWNHIYTNELPEEIKQWVDEHMNCEDIAMNFLVANITSQAPIKVTPRKKFRCPECTNTEMLSAYLDHMRERSACIDRFARIFGRMPLRSVEFRADPVLFRDNFPEKLKRFNDIGSL